MERVFHQTKKKKPQTPITDPKKQQSQFLLHNLATFAKEKESGDLINSCFQAELNSSVIFYVWSFGWNWRTETHRLYSSQLLGGEKEKPATNLSFTNGKYSFVA